MPILRFKCGCPATTSFLKDVLGNPLYAGAYVYGRWPIEVVVKGGQAVKRQRTARAAEDARVFIAGHHEGYSPWDTYQRHQDAVRGNGSNFMHDEAALVVRSGQGLLTGLLRCAAVDASYLSATGANKAPQRVPTHYSSTLNAEYFRILRLSYPPDY